MEGLKGRAEAENLVNIYAAIAEITPEAVIAEHGGEQFSTFKAVLGDLAVSKLNPLASEMRKLLADPAEIDRVLKEGAARADAIATPVMEEVRRLVGFLG